VSRREHVIEWSFWCLVLGVRVRECIGHDLVFEVLVSRVYDCALHKPGRKAGTSCCAHIPYMR
jgi:hypothetical protein